ncbi:MAG TPA: aminoacyl-tRNA hydrolase [Leptospiraceae bacterium]|nr:aminoacyl-tRNA hydrolase [Leptospiraceae bacterium]
MNTNYKQVLVWRKDLNVRKGKIAAQLAHASIKWLTDRIKKNLDKKVSDLLTEEEESWINGNFKKVVVYVENEGELLKLFDSAKESGLTVSLITDAGLTEFHGQPTNTCLCIGSHLNEKIDPLTKDLKLL